MKNVEKLEIKKLCIKLKPYIKMDKKLQSLMILELKNTYEFHQLKSFQFHFSKHKKSFFYNF